MTNTRPFGAAVGNTLGSTAAHAEHVVLAAASAVVYHTGLAATHAGRGYTRVAAQRKDQRLATDALRRSLGVKITPIGVIITA